MTYLAWYLRIRDLAVWTSDRKLEAAGVCGRPGISIEFGIDNDRRHIRRRRDQIDIFLDLREQLVPHLGMVSIGKDSPLAYLHSAGKIFELEWIDN